MGLANDLNPQPKYFRPFAEVGPSLALFLLALLPRAYDLPRFVTADEAKWVFRSAQFLTAFLQGDWAGTTVNLTPAVTTTWLGSLGLFGYYQWHRASLAMPLRTWLLSLPEFRVDLDLLVAVRWPMVILTALGVVGCYWLLRFLFDPALAFLAAAFSALDPHPISLGRILGHDAPVTEFMILALLLLLLARRHHRLKGWLLFSLSGIAAGLAFLSKAPALFLIPFAGLLWLAHCWSERSRCLLWSRHFALWGLVAYVTFVVVWPAAWLEPLGRPYAVVENGFLSATDQEEAEAEGFWLVPDLGPFYYLVNAGFKLSPLVMVGAAAGLIRLVRKYPAPSPASRSTLLWLVAFILLFTLFMTLGGKRSPRYILPIFPALALLAAWGWQGLYQQATASLSQPDRALTGLWPLFSGLLIFAGLVILLPYAPYYSTYFNPLLGGAATAPRLVKIGWGEGLDQVGRFLQRELPGRRVGTAYSSTLAPFYEGDVAGLASDRLDYVVLYLKQVQSGSAPLLPGVVRYYQHTGSIFSVDLNGIHYADVFPGPAVQLAAAPATTGLYPFAFRPQTAYGPIGQPLAVEVLWAATGPLPDRPAVVTLEPLTAGPVISQGAGSLERIATELTLSRHELPIPPETGRGRYRLQVDGDPLGEIELRNFQLPANMAEVFVSFDEQIALRAYRFTPTADYLEVKLAWQAQANYLPDYTVFVQLLDAASDTRLAGIDSQPEQGAWPTSRWVKDEVVVDTYYLAIPPDLRPGHFKMIAGLYQPGSGQRLRLADGRDHWLLPWSLIREEQ
jgi:hypothetical protein